MKGRVFVAAAVLAVVAGLAGCAEAKSLSPCSGLTVEERGGLLAAGVTHAGKAKSEAGYVIYLSPTVFERSGNGDRAGVDFHYQAAGDRYGTDVSFAKLNTIPADLQPVAAAARACSTEL